ncbi:MULTISPECIES: class I SAM-dependent methyltransferase [unclassified Streptomyces]|uniref:class I SAM-dependent methyltransferase n=1 Tax=unclassified Streptomyces TaxID=2593676 RepID=UPI000F6BB302|nr:MULTISPECIES: class I SAM-dependent methyltransferase [unclassified Streptomyces]AZM59058.1 SAM-dependent methyltransferase [Streptomyces sp. WAC 01438]RSM96834.1 SAM-dependent methyltransferase [Streptomyces sp. WAC 01420]
MDAQHWDDMYRSREHVFSGSPNPVLVGEVTGLTPGRALDVGCGEGADALWLARQGWQVTAVDISATALRRAAAAADPGLRARVSWQQADLTVTPPPAAGFDLVSLHYFPLRRRPGHTTLRRLLDAVAPGGTLLFATHARDGLTASGDFDPADYYQPDDIAPLLAPDWTILVHTTRPRTGPAPAGTRHTHDTVLRAVRRP